MRHGTKADAAQVPVRLTVEEIADRGESMATKLLHINALRASRLDAMQKAQKLIDNELDELGRLARVVMDSSELRRQGDLFRDQQPDVVQATEALAEVAKRAEAVPCGECDGSGTRTFDAENGGPPETFPCEDCSGSGVIPHGAEEPLPTVTDIPDVCGTCGNSTRGIGDHVYTCSDSDCPWTVRVVGDWSGPAKPGPGDGVEFSATDESPEQKGKRLAQEIVAARERREETAAEKIKRQRREKRAQRLAQAGDATSAHAEAGADDAAAATSDASEQEVERLSRESQA